MRAVLVGLLLLASSSAFAAEEKLLDDDWTIKSGASQEYSFEMKRAGKVHVEVRGVKYADKGLKVSVKPDEGGAETTKSYVRDFDAEKGSHVVTVANSENLLHTATVHVLVVVK